MANSSMEDRLLQPVIEVQPGARSCDDEFRANTLQPSSSDGSVHTESKITHGLPKPTRGFVSIGLFVTCLYSTIMSGVFLVIAAIQPKYGRTISNHGRFTPSSAALLTAFLAKTIELSFVMLFLVFLGQHLSRRAMRHQGITLSAVAMRSWILQPGTLITQWQTVRVVGLSMMGLLSLVAAVLSLLYTTAAGAIVQPQLRLPDWERRTLYGEVYSDVSNVNQASATCTEQWPDLDDKDWGGSTCMQVNYASTCYSNFNNYLKAWRKDPFQIDALNATSLVKDRRRIDATLDNNVTVFTAWLEPRDIKSDSTRTGRITNNITIVLPHRSVPAAARFSHNGLMQPEDLPGGGSYVIDAHTANPALSALCVNANKTELAPIVYETWPNSVRNASLWPLFAFSRGSEPDNHTVLDSIFGWQDTSINRLRARPVFFKFPVQANTIANHTSYPWGKVEVYLLSRAPDKALNQTPEYTLCSLKAGIVTSCLTRYNASSGGQSLEAICDDSTDHKFDQCDVEGYEPNPNWRDTGFDLLNAMSLNTGAMDGSSSLARVFTQLSLKTPELNKNLPSPAEALLSMSTCTLLDLAKGYPFAPGWVGYHALVLNCADTWSYQNYTLPSLEKPVLQQFDAFVREAQYMSGGETSYQRGFLAVLALTFLINCFILVYFGLILRIRLITDLCEPLVLFLLGYHTPSDNLFRSLPSDGLHKDDYSVRWIAERRLGQLVVVAEDDASKVNDSEETSSIMRLRPWKALSRSRSRSP